MASIFKTHRYAATFDGESPDESPTTIEADSLEGLEELVLNEGHNLNEATLFYRLQVEASTSWGRIDDSTDYEILLNKLTRDFRFLGNRVLADTPITQIRNLHYTDSDVDEAQRDWDSDYTTDA